MEVKQRAQGIFQKVKSSVSKFRENFVEKNEFSQKVELKFKTFKVIGLIGVLVFVAVVFLMPTDIPVEFTEKIDRPEPSTSEDKTGADPNQASSSAQGLWGSPKMPTAHWR
jgi:cytoskeletal protein RodZ